MKLPRLPRGEVGPDGLPLSRNERLPTWLRITVRVAVLWPFVLLALVGGLAERIADRLNPYLPRGL